jgi:hypothetical protein
MQSLVKVDRGFTYINNNSRQTMSNAPLLQALGYKGSLQSQKVAATPNEQGIVTPQDAAGQNPYNALDQVKTPLLDSLGMGIRAAAKGLASVPDTVLQFAPTLDKLTADLGDPNQYEETPAQLKQGGDLSTYDQMQANAKANPNHANVHKVIDKLSDVLGLAKPITDSEKKGSEAITGAVGFAAFPGGSTKIAGKLGEAAAGALSGSAQEGSRQAGDSEQDQMIAGLTAGALGLIVAHKFTSKWGAKVAEEVKANDPHDVFDEQGNLTEQGQHVAAKAGLDSEQLKNAYEDAAQSTEEAASKHYDDVKQARDEGQALLDQGLGTAEQQAALKQSIGKADEVLAKLEEVKGPAQDAKPVETPAPEHNPEGVLPPVAEDFKDLKRSEVTPEQRAADFERSQVPYTTGDVTQKFGQQAQERGLEADGQPHLQQQSDAARDFRQKQEEAILDKGENLIKAVDEEAAQMPPDQKGSILSQALKAIREGQYNRIVDLYRNLSKVKKAPLIMSEDIAGLKEKFLEAIGTPGLDNSIKTGLQQIAAEFGLVGKETGKPNLWGERVIDLGEDTKPINISGPQKKLNLANAFELRKKINALYKDGVNNPQVHLLDAVDKAVGNRLEELANKAQGSVAKRFQAANQAWKEFKDTWADGSLLDKIVKKDPSILDPGKIADNIIGTNAKAYENLKRVKTILLSSKDPKALLAWKCIQTEAMFNIIKRSLYNGGKLNLSSIGVAIDKLGKDKLKLLFDSKTYNDLFALRRVVEYSSKEGLKAQLERQNRLSDLIYHALKFGSLPLGHGASHIVSVLRFTLGEKLINQNEAKQAEEVLEKMLNPDLTGGAPKKAGEGFKFKSPLTEEDIAKLANYLGSANFLADSFKVLEINQQQQERNKNEPR